MILDIVESIDGYPIRLTEERWYDHIVFRRPYMSGYLETVLDAVYYPEFILPADDGSKVAVLNVGKNQWLHVFYIEYVNEDNKKDGFVTTAYIKPEYNRKKRKIWQRDN